MNACAQPAVLTATQSSAESMCPPLVPGRIGVQCGRDAQTVTGGALEVDVAGRVFFRSGMVIEPDQQLGRPPTCVDWLIACVSGGASHCAKGFHRSACSGFGDDLRGLSVWMSCWTVSVLVRWLVVSAVRLGGGGVEVGRPVGKPNVIHGFGVTGEAVVAVHQLRGESLNLRGSQLSNLLISCPGVGGVELVLDDCALVLGPNVFVTSKLLSCGTE
eukprot:6470880-Amphidinium_carterae.3